MLSICFFLLLSELSVHASSRVDEVYQKTASQIQASRLMQLPVHEDYLHLQEFLQSPQAQDWVKEVYTLSPAEKVELYKKIAAISGGPFTYIGRRNHLAALVLTHQDDAKGIKLIDIKIGFHESFLSRAAVHDDLDGISFAIKLQSRVIHDGISPILGSIKSPRAAELLLTLPQFQQLTPDERVTILQGPASPIVSPGVWDVFKEYGFNLHILDANQNTLLHDLAESARYYSNPTAWEMKFLALRHAELNPLLKNGHAATALDRIKSSLRRYPDHATLLRAQTLLQEWEQEVRHNAPPPYSN